MIKQLDESATLLASERQMPFTKAMLEMAERENIQVFEIAGHKDGNVLIATSNDKRVHSIRVAVKELGVLIRTLKKHGDTLMHVNDY